MFFDDVWWGFLGEAWVGKSGLGALDVEVEFFEFAGESFSFLIDVDESGDGGGEFEGLSGGIGDDARGGAGSGEVGWVYAEGFESGEFEDGFSVLEDEFGGGRGAAEVG